MFDPKDFSNEESSKSGFTPGITPGATPEVAFDILAGDSMGHVRDPLQQPKSPFEEKGKKEQFPELAEKPYWGRKDPESEYVYTDRDGEPCFYVARFTYSGSIRQDFVPAFYNGAEWVKKVPETFDRSRPLMNLVDLYDESKHILDKEVIIVQNEFHYQKLSSLVEAENLPYVITTWHGQYKGIRRTQYDQGLTNRNVILFPDNDDFSLQLFDILKGCVSPYVQQLRIIDSRSQGLGWGPVQAVNNCNGEDGAKSFELLLNLLAEAEVLQKDTPSTEVNEYGIGHLETPIPLGFILNTVEEFGEMKPNGRKSIASTYNACMRVVEHDPAFKDFLKYDEAIASPIWDFSKYPTIDDLKNAVLRRLSQYGANVSKQIRDDIVMSLSNDTRRKINSVREYFEYLVSQHPDATESDLDKFMTYIKISSADGEEEALNTGRPYAPYNREAFRHFFIKSCLRLYTAYSKTPIPNDAVLVFVGKQGIGKTRLCKYMAMDVERYVDLGNKSAPFGSPDWVRHIIGKFIAELGEMNVMRKSEVETIKSGISEVFDSLTPKFKEGVKSIPRTVNFLGTSNELEFLKDMSGNRRFFPLEMADIDHDGLYANKHIIEKIWAYYYSMVRDAMSFVDSAGKLLPYQKDPPLNMIRMSDKLTTYFNVARDNATDVGITGDLIYSIIIRMEKVKYNSGNTGKAKSLIFDVAEIVSEMFAKGQEHMARDDIKKKAKYWLAKLGYELDYVVDHGRTVRVFKIHKDNPLLLKRMSFRALDKSLF